MAAFIGFYLSEFILGSCPGASQLTPLTTCQLDVSVTKMQYFVTMLDLSYDISRPLTLTHSFLSYQR